MNLARGSVAALGKLVVQVIHQAVAGRKPAEGTLKQIEEGFDDFEQRLQSVENHFIRFGAPLSQGVPFIKECRYPCCSCAKDVCEHIW